MQINLRHFNNSDSGFISKQLWSNTTQDEAIAMINEWNTLKHKDSYFEMLAIETDSGLTGYTSIYEIAGNASIGIEIVPQYRDKGIGSQAVIEAMRHAKKLGYKKATGRVLTDNLSSLRLCEKVGLIIIGNDTTVTGKAVYCLEKKL